jgi:hypothetical protein
MISWRDLYYKSVDQIFLHVALLLHMAPCPSKTGAYHVLSQLHNHERYVATSLYRGCWSYEYRTLVPPDYICWSRLYVARRIVSRSRYECSSGLKLLVRLHPCSVCGPATIFLTSKITYLFFSTPPIKLKLGL